MTYRWVTVDWDGHCSLWAGTVPPQWDEEQGRYDSTPEDDLEHVRITPLMATRLTRRAFITPGTIYELMVTTIKQTNRTV